MSKPPKKHIVYARWREHPTSPPFDSLMDAWGECLTTDMDDKPLPPARPRMITPVVDSSWTEGDIPYDGRVRDKPKKIVNGRAGTNAEGWRVEMRWEMSKMHVWTAEPGYAYKPDSNLILKVTSDALQAILRLYQEAGCVHGDINPSKMVGYYDRTRKSGVQGVIIDYDYQIPKESLLPGHYPRTGV